MGGTLIQTAIHKTCDILFSCGRCLNFCIVCQGSTRNRTSRTSSMRCTPPQYLLANHSSSTSAASPIITIAPVIHRNHLHILCVKVAALCEEQHVGRWTILTGFTMQGYSLRPRPSK